MDVGSNTGFGVTMKGPEGRDCGGEDEERAFGDAWKAWRAKRECSEVPANRITSA